MTGTMSSAGTRVKASSSRSARQNLADLLSYVAQLYCMGGSSTISAHEAQELTLSVTYVLGISDATVDEAAHVLDVEDPIALWHEGLSVLDPRVDTALSLWGKVVATMPPIRNVALRDTLASLGELRRRYDTRFAAHVVPCDIDYPLSEPVNDRLLGIDYIEAWLTQLLKEAVWLARFDVRSCVTTLETSCPDYRGLHVNLYDLLLPHERELELVDTDGCNQRQHG